VAQGEREAALTAYRASLEIAETLARRDPANTQWQRDLIVSLWKIADNYPANARGYLTRALEIARGLQTTERLAPVDAWMPEKLRRRLAALANE
jgi:hypothetical protein